MEKVLIKGKGYPMNLTTAEQPTAVLLERLDAIIDELQVLRQTVQAMQSMPAEINLTQQLYGAFGQGTWAEYEADLDWQRFSS